MLKLTEDFDFYKLHDAGFVANTYGTKFVSYCGAITIFANTQNVVIDNAKSSVDTVRILKNLLEQNAFVTDDNPNALSANDINFDFNSLNK